MRVYTDSDREIAVNELLYTIKENPSITELTFWNHDINTIIDQANLIRFVAEHPFMVKLNFLGNRIAPQDAVIFIRQHKSLKMFRFQINNQAEYDQLVSQLDSEWKHERENDNDDDLITLTRQIRFF